MRSAKWAQEIMQLRPGPAHVCLYLGFKGDIREAGVGPNNLWFYNTWDSEENAWQVSPDAINGDKMPVLYVSFPSLKDKAHQPGPDQKHTGEAVTFVPWETFSKWRDKKWMRRGDDYDSFKNRMQEAMLEQLFLRLPKLESMLDYAELSTPVSTDYFMRSFSGSIYGLESTPERFNCRWLRARTPIPGLLFAGVDAIGTGIAGGAIGGAFASIAAEPFPVARWLYSNVF